MADLSRRGFLKALGIGGAGAVAGGMMLDPEKLLWVPGAKTWFLPSKKLYKGELVTDPDAIRYLSKKLFHMDHAGSRYHMTVGLQSAKKDLFFDDQWRVMGAYVDGAQVKLTEKKAMELAAEAGVVPEQRSPLEMKLGGGRETGWRTGDQRYHMEQVSLSDDKTVTERKIREMTDDESWDTYWNRTKRIAAQKQELTRPSPIINPFAGDHNNGMQGHGMVEVEHNSGMTEWVPAGSDQRLLDAANCNVDEESRERIADALRERGIVLPSRLPWTDEDGYDEELEKLWVSGD